MPETSKGHLGMLPERYALVIAGTYLVIGSTYIAFSDRIVSRLASSVAHLERLEMLKGWGFVLVTAVGLYTFSRALFRRIAAAGLRLAKQEEAYHLLDRRALAGALASAVAHDGNNMLTVAKMATGELLDRPEPEIRKLAEDLDGSLDQLVAMLRRLRDLGRQARSEDARTVDLVAEVEQVLRRIRKHDHVRPCNVSFAASGTVPLRVYPVLVDELVSNLVLNAAEAPSQRIEVAVQSTSDGATLTVSDDGPGVPEALRERVFEPFFTTKDHGTGLGLLSVRGCADAHHGSVSLEASPLGGSRFVVTLHAIAESSSSLRSG